MSAVSRVFVFSVMLVALAACREPHGQERWPGAVVVGTESSERLTPDYLRMAPTDFEPGETELEIAREVAARHEEILDRQPPARVLAETELVFLATGRLPELADYYKQAVDRQGPTSALRARLAWVQQRLGLEDLAMETARVAVKATPDDPFAHFVLAFCLGQQSDRYADAFVEVITELRTVFRLDPDFDVPGVVSNSALRGELDRLAVQHAPNTGAPAEAVPSSDLATPTEDDTLDGVQ